MGRKIKERAFEEEGEARRLPSNTDVKKYQDRILELRQKLKKLSGDIRAEIKDVYADADNVGIEKQTLKLNIKLIELGLTFEQKAMSNIYFDKTGQGSFFALEQEQETAA